MQRPHVARLRAIFYGLHVRHAYLNCFLRLPYQFSPDGSVFVSASMDGQMFLFDGKTGEKTGTFGSPAHKGGIYAVSFSSDGSKVLSGTR